MASRVTTGSPTLDGLVRRDVDRQAPRQASGPRPGTDPTSPVPCATAARLPDRRPAGRRAGTRVLRPARSTWTTDRRPRTASTADVRGCPDRRRTVAPRRPRPGPSADALSRHPPRPRVGGCRVACAARIAAAVDQASSGISARAGQSSGGQIRSSVSIRASPSRTTGWRTSQRRNRRFVTRPRTTVSSSARVSRSRAVGAVGPPGDDLGEHRVEPAADLACPARSRHRPGCPRRPASAAPRSGRSPAGSPPRRPRRTAGPRRHGRARPVRRPVRLAAARRPRSASWSATRSRPVTSSVTGCSTWSRVFISRNVKAPRSSTRNSQVPALTYPTARARVRAAVAEPLAERRHRPPGTASPRGSSGGDAGSSSRARRAGCRCRAESNRTWTSTWRAPSTSRSRISRSSPNAAAASRRAAASASRSRSVLADDPHALAAAPGRGFDQQRVADPVGGRLAGPRRSGPARRSRRAPGCRANAPGAVPRPCRPSVRIASGGGPTQRMPGGHRSSANAAFSARNPKPGWIASAPAVACGRDHRVRVEEVEGVRARRWRARRRGSQAGRRCARCGSTISPRLAMNSVSDGRGRPATREASLPRR